jgi:hypothetical protein
VNLFGPRQVADHQVRLELQSVRQDVEKLASALRNLELEQQTLHDQVRKWMRRAVAAERNAEQNQEPPAAQPAAPPVPPRLWGARARRLMRGTPVPDVVVSHTEGDSNGVHS